MGSEALHPATNQLFSVPWLKHASSKDSISSDTRMLQSLPTLALAEKCPTELPLGPSSPQPLLSSNLSSHSKLGVSLPKRVFHQHKEDCKMTLAQRMVAVPWNHDGDFPLGPPLCPTSAGSGLYSLW